MSSTITDALMQLQPEIEKWRELAQRQSNVIARLEKSLEEANALTKQAVAAGRQIGEQRDRSLAQVVQERAMFEAAIVKLEARIKELLEANNAEVNRRRKFEGEAAQEYVEKLLLRNECIRLRDAHGILAGFIEGLPEEIEAPEAVAAAMDAAFPLERKAAGADESDRDRMDRLEGCIVEVRNGETGRLILGRAPGAQPLRWYVDQAFAATEPAPVVERE